MHQQGLFSGKTEGDLESIPGYYGGTASYQFVQNAKALNQHRVVRHLKQAALAEQAGSFLPSLTPSAARIAAYKAAKSLKGVKTLTGPARGEAIKSTVEKKAPSNFIKDANGNMVYRPNNEKVVAKEVKDAAVAEASAAAPAAAPAPPQLVPIPGQQAAMGALPAA